MLINPFSQAKYKLTEQARQQQSFWTDIAFLNVPRSSQHSHKPTGIILDWRNTTRSFQCFHPHFRVNRNPSTTTSFISLGLSPSWSMQRPWGHKQFILPKIAFKTGLKFTKSKKKEHSCLTNSYPEQTWSLSKENVCIPASFFVLWYGHFSFCSSMAWFSKVLRRWGGNITDAGKKAETNKKGYFSNQL